ncbi:MAG TPA: FAD-dependent oxidoreductase, partial [Actinomycetes bacterium]|nr:FAD-dependent oxidoreductase [Actinomycetes bacterium]
MSQYVVIGGGLAGAKAVETLRTEGFDGSVVLVSGEKQVPYERPPLSKGFLLGTEAAEKAQVHEPGWYA